MSTPLQRQNNRQEERSTLRVSTPGSLDVRHCKKVEIASDGSGTAGQVLRIPTNVDNGRVVTFTFLAKPNAGDSVDIGPGVVTLTTQDEVVNLEFNNGSWSQL